MSGERTVAGAPLGLTAPAQRAEAEPAISVIVPARDAAATLPACLDALASQDYPRAKLEIIVVDDGSSDDTAAIARRERVSVISTPPAGPAAARNRGIEAARGDLILFTDADCVPRSDWARRLAGALADPGVGAAKGIYRSEQKAWTARFVQAEYESRYRIMSQLAEIDFIDTYSAAYRRSVLVDAGGFDESFPLPCVEDQELSFRLKRRGVRMVFCSTAVVGHRHAATPLAYFRKKLKIARWKTRVLLRYPERAVKDSHTPQGLKLEVASAGLFLAALPAGALHGAFLALAAAALATFAAAAAPFACALLPKNPGLAWRSPFFLFLRAAALALGTALGVCGLALSGRARERRMRPAEPALRGPALARRS